MIPYYALSTINIGPLSLNVWGLFAGLAFAAALVIALMEAKRKNIKEEYVFDLAILTLAGGVIGARAAFILENWDYFKQNTDEILSFSQGGLMFFGGAIGVIILIGIYLKIKKLNIWIIIDGLMPSFAIGEFIGRIGCALADLHIGAKTALPWAQAYIDGSYRHPIAIYMSLNGLAMFLVFWFLRAKVNIQGALFLFFVLWYSGTRFFLDFFRCGDLTVCDPRYSGYTPSQYISFGVFIIALIILINKYKKYMAEKQNSGKAKGTAEDFKNLQSSAVSYTEVEKIFFESEINNPNSGANSGSNANWKDRIRVIAKKTWILPVIAVFALVLGALGAAAYYNSIYYGKMFKNPLFSFQGKTWVSYDMPIINLTLISDAACERCSAENVINGLKANLMPTLAVKTADYNSKEGKNAIIKFGIKSLPAFIFDSGVEKLDNFNQLSQVFKQIDSQYYLDYLDYPETQINPGKFLELPKITAEDRSKGPESAPVTIIEFSDFQCPFCKQENEVVKQVLAAYPDKVRLVFKHFPLSIHADAEFAAEAAECAGDQGKFFEMADMIFTNQTKLDKASIAKYAKNIKLDAKKFKDCADSGKFKTKIANDSKTAAEFGISGTPAFFIGDEFFGSAIPFEQFKEIIDRKLAK